MFPTKKLPVAKKIIYNKNFPPKFLIFSGFGFVEFEKEEDIKKSIEQLSKYNVDTNHTALRVMSKYKKKSQKMTYNFF
jgi:RNA recognition motif-containing protein